MKARNYNTNANTNTQREEKPTLIVTSHKCIKARTDSKGIVRADVEINGITIYGMAIMANKSTGEAFLSWPSQKGQDRKYYSVCYGRLSDTDQETIIGEIYAWLDANT